MSKEAQIWISEDPINGIVEEDEATMTSRRKKRIEQLAKGLMYVQRVLKAVLMLKLSLWTDVKIKTLSLKLLAAVLRALVFLEQLHQHRK